MKKKLFYLLLLLSVIVGILIYRTNQQVNHQSADTANAASSNENSKSNQQTIKTKQTKIKQKLQKYLDTVTADKTASVSFYNLSPVSGSKAAKSSNAAVYQEGKLAVSANAHTAEVAASTFKLFITAFLMKEKQAGNFSWTTANQSGFENMIVYSQNDYADEQLSNYGLSTINSFIANQGWYSPVFVEGQDAETTATSLIYLLKQLAEGTGVFSNSSDRNYILGLMKKQVYRKGIPTGAAEAMKGTTVQDKVGFLDDTNNDAGIVTLPNGQRYLLVVMTHGHNQSGFSGFPRIAKITKHIQEIVYGN
ncbi:serine hydrolase [Liquorilactobacillus sicerae]|uniref:serine hydrolase n=1 Tax=Liquorilactobacillus sicerae TaxID=1416943 RepID=UPI0024806660|nr:serine hydrolase [Liquorilactobacillus sicerae]